MKGSTFDMPRSIAMLRSLAALAIGVLVTAGCSGDTVRPATSASSASGPVDIGAGLRGPSGLRATIYATGLPKAAALAFDHQRRLWVATADYSDMGLDGLFVVTQAGASPIEVVSGLHTPLGLLWIQQTLYVASKESVDAYEGFDGTTFATHHNVVALPTGAGEVNGLVHAPDGRIQLGISAPCDHCVPTSEFSGTVVSFLPDGTDLRVDAKGIRAPIGLAYFPGTSDLFVTMNQRDDLGDATTADVLSVVQRGQDWRFPDCYGQGGAVCAGVPQPVATLDKHAAVSGVAIVTGQLGAHVGTAAIVAEWQIGVVQQVSLAKSGSTYTGTVTPFLTGLQNPVPVVFGTDNALYVGDWTTGTIYRIASS